MNLIVQTPDERLAALTKPILEPVTQFELTADDWLIVCAGFEDRALGVLQNAVSGGNRFNVLIVDYRPFFPENRLNAIRTICQDAHLNGIELLYNREEPAGFGAALIEKLSFVAGRIFVDISAMSRLLIVQTLVALGTRSIGFEGCLVAYAEAKKYPPTREEAGMELARCESDPTFSILFLSSGVFEITVVPELSSPAPAGAQTRLIAFPSLDAHQLTALRVEVQPSRFSFIEGVPPSAENKWRQQVIAQLNCLDQVQDAERTETSTLDYRETLDALLKLYSEHSLRDRLVLSPTGSKMQTVAAGIFRAIIADVQIAYPTPHGFRKPDGYTLGIGPLHLLPLSPFSNALEAPAAVR
jgi:hypothetical protein